MGLFDFFKKKNTENSSSSSHSTEQKLSFEELDEIIEKEVEVGDFGGATPNLTLRKSGNIYLIVDCPPFIDGDGNEIHGDSDFPEVYEFENLISEYIGVEVEREDREVFIIPNPKADSLEKVKEFIENYWTLRKDIYKKKNIWYYDSLKNAVRKDLLSNSKINFLFLPKIGIIQIWSM